MSKKKKKKKKKLNLFQEIIKCDISCRDRHDGF